jgi:hypothetical protein
VAVFCSEAPKDYTLDDSAKIPISMDSPYEFSVTVNGLDISGAHLYMNRSEPLDITPRVSMMGVNVLEPHFGYAKKTWIVAIYLIQDKTIEQVLQQLKKDAYKPAELTLTECTV